MEKILNSNTKINHLRNKLKNKVNHVTYIKFDILKKEGNEDKGFPTSFKMSHKNHSNFFNLTLDKK